ncbi:hypothetical protein FBQ98_03590 [Gammaproteobacteria bacterium PRO6]|nr:hypothetical protein [Gammaproteobacteria bacterium PRO6]
MPDPTSCPVCRSDAIHVLGTEDHGSRTRINCARCGRYTIAKMARIRLQAEPLPDYRLSAWLRAQEVYGSDEPLLVQERIPQLRLSLPTYGVSERTLELLKALATLSRSPGTYYSGSLHADSPLAWAATDDELRFHLDALRESGFIDFETIDLDANYRARLTAKGWDHVEKGPATVLPRAFVAMSFSETMLPTWIEGLRPGIEDAGYSAHRVDSDVHVHRIDQKIVADIRTSRFVVVDVTEQKQGAYFEAGLALGFGKTVVWTVREDDLRNVHFDTRQFAHIVWASHADLREKLRDVIVAVLGSGPRLTS